jgi:hypothetical protein
MERKFLEMIRDKTQDPGFRDLLDLLIRRCVEYELLNRTTYDHVRENRARREGISVVQIERAAARATREYAPTPKEIAQFEESQRITVEQSNSDIELFEMAWHGDVEELSFQRSMLEIKSYPENVPMIRRLVDYLEESRRLLKAFAESRHWPIPEPHPWDLPRPTTTLSAAKRRSLREQATKKVLQQAGFVKGKYASYVRRQGLQIHFINFQSHNREATFTINLGFHYVFLRPIYTMRKMPLTELCEVDCFMRARIGRFRNEHEDTWFEYGNDAAAYRTLVEQLARDCLAIFDKYAERWRDPLRLVAEWTNNPPATNPWDCWSDLCIVEIMLRSCGALDKAQATLVQYQNDQWSERRQWAQQLSKRLEELERNDTKAKSESTEDWFESGG